MALGAIVAPSAASSSPGEADATLSISVDGDRVTVAAENASLDRILDTLAVRIGFAVERSGSRYAPLPVTGQRTGTLNDVLAWLLSRQNYILFHEHLDGDGGAVEVRPSQLLLMNPPIRGANAAPGAVERIRLAGADPTFVNRGGRPLAGAGERPRDLLAVAPVADNAVARGTPAPGGGVPAKAAERLSASGIRLSNIVVDAGAVDIVRRVNLGGDAPVATHVMAHKAAGPSLQRTHLGTWIPWDGQEASLIDNRFTPANGGVTFDVVKGDLSNEFFPMTFTIAYRTESGLKFGSFQVMPDQRLRM